MAVRVDTREPAAGGDRAEVARVANERIADKATRLQFVSPVPLLCECSTPGCRAIVTIAVEEYDEIRGRDGFLTAPGHEPSVRGGAGSAPPR
jgi:hypothetical protein